MTQQGSEMALPEMAVSGSRREPALCLAGPTAVGKSGLAVVLARRLGGEIVSVDSMQVYRGMDLGTAKPTAADRAEIPHHLVDVVEVRESFDAARFARLASPVLAEILGRGRIPILCGGTGLYFKALMGGLDDRLPASDPAVRASLEATPPEVLLEELAVRDPATWATIDRRNPRRVIRAVEVIRLTGRPFSDLRSGARPAGVGGSGDWVWVGLERDAEDLRRRIETRVDEMFGRGLVEETRRLMGAGLWENRTAMQALGYRQVVEHLNGVRGLDETMRLVKDRTWQFARRQMTYFRRQLPLNWLRWESGWGTEVMADRVLARCAARGLVERLVAPGGAA